MVGPEAAGLLGSAAAKFGVGASSVSRARIVSESLCTNADDRLPAAPLSRVEGGDSIVEGRDVADVRPQSSVPHPLDDLTQLGTIRLDNEEDRQTRVPPALIRLADRFRSTSFIPDVPAAWSVTTIAFIRHLRVSSSRLQKTRSTIR